MSRAAVFQAVSVRDLVALTKPRITVFALITAGIPLMILEYALACATVARADDEIDRVISEAGKTQKSRQPTRPGRAAVKRRLDNKARRGETKRLRRKIED